jgi:hypothetical protein
MFSMQQLAEFKIVYPGEKVPSLEDLISGIDKQTVVDRLTHHIGSELHAGRDTENGKIIGKWFTNETVAKAALDKITSAEHKLHQPLKIIAVISCLDVVQFCLDRDSSHDTPKSYEQAQIDIYKALLVCNENTNYHQTRNKAKLNKMFPKHGPAATMLSFSSLHTIL